MDFWEEWPVFGWFALLWKSSAIDNSKLYKMVLDKMKGRSFKKMLNILSVDLNTGDIVIFDETTPVEKQPDAMMASASIPVLFPPQETLLEHAALADGGLFTQVQIDEPIIRCKEAGYDDKDIIVDVIACFSDVATIKEWTLTESKYKNAYDIFNRKNMFEYYYLWYLEDILRIVKGFPNVNFRHLIMPEEELTSTDIPIFDSIEVNFKLIA
jgi:predicted acylesterase/phospholipase RssA